MKTVDQLINEVRYGNHREKKEAAEKLSEICSKHTGLDRPWIPHDVRDFITKTIFLPFS